jgi:hypothetical protein
MVTNDDLIAAATQRFIQEVKLAKVSGVDVSGIFLEVQDQIVLAWVRAFGLMFGIIWIFICPLLIPIYKVYCFRIGLAYQLNEWFYLWPCAVGLVSIIAFGYNLVDPRSLKRITGRSESEKDHVITDTGTFIKYHVPKPLPPGRAIDFPEEQNDRNVWPPTK